MAKQYHKNPRQITTKQMTMLAHDLAELGDLSGIVHNLNTDEIIIAVCKRKDKNSVWLQVGL